MNLFLKAIWGLVILFLSLKGMGQEKTEIDSLKEIFYSQSSYQTDLGLLKALCDKSLEPDSTIKYSELLKNAALKLSERELLLSAYWRQGVAWQRKGNFDKALDNLFKAAELAEALDKISSLGAISVEIANVYSESDNSSMAFPYYKNGIEIARKMGDSLVLGQTLYNFGDDLYEEGKLDTALVVTKEARVIFQRFKNYWYEAYSIGNLGRIFTDQGETDKAERYLKRAIDTLKKRSDYSAIADFSAALADVSLQRGNTAEAIKFAERSLIAAKQHKLKEDLKNAYYKLSHLYETAGNTDEALHYYKQYVIYKDSLEDVETYRSMANLRTDYEIAKKQTEVDLLNERTRNQQTILVGSVITVVLILLIALGLYRRNKFIGRTKKIIESEKNRSEILLLNILPQETAKELKERGKVQPKRFDAVSILFTDFKNFTHYAENLSPEELVKSVDFYFSEFDRIIEKYGLEKIKTVGDAYMCAAGVPFPVEDHAVKTVAAACEMIQFVEKAKTLSSDKETRFEMRIGIHSGPAIAGVVGTKKFAYDVWGDTVNIASRMESTSSAGKINISGSTYELVKHRFDCEYRGEISAKSKGRMKMYFVKWC